MRFNGDSAVPLWCLEDVDFVDQQKLASGKWPKRLSDCGEDLGPYQAIINQCFLTHLPRAYVFSVLFWTKVSPFEKKRLIAKSFHKRNAVRRVILHG